MIDAGIEGSIVNLGSLSGLEAAPNVIDYGAANAAVIHLTRSIALELAPHGIRVNCIVPGAHKTESVVAAAAENPEIARWVERNSAATPLGRLGEPSETGGVAVFLASRLSSYVTGQEIVVDGGMQHTTARPPVGRVARDEGCGSTVGGGARLSRAVASRSGSDRCIRRLVGGTSPVATTRWTPGLPAMWSRAPCRSRVAAVHVARFGRHRATPS